MRDKEDEKEDKGFVGKAVESVKKHPVKTAAILGTVGVGGWLLHRWLKGRKDRKEQHGNH